MKPKVDTIKHLLLLQILLQSALYYCYILSVPIDTDYLKLGR